MTYDEGWLQQSPLLTAKYWRHGWTTSQGPDFRADPTSGDIVVSVAELVQATGLEVGAWARQVHGGRVLEVTERGFAGEADALWSVQPGLGVVGRPSSPWVREPPGFSWRKAKASASTCGRPTSRS